MAAQFCPNINILIMLNISILPMCRLHEIMTECGPYVSRSCWSDHPPGLLGCLNSHHISWDIHRMGLLSPGHFQCTLSLYHQQEKILSSYLRKIVLFISVFVIRIWIISLYWMVYIHSHHINIQYVSRNKDTALWCFVLFGHVIISLVD